MVQGRGGRRGDGGREGELREIPAGPECILSTSGVSVRASLTLRCS